ncbi:MAG: 1-acyl-sn-glycerol-3-phosphate acyltransferase [Myxococcales bacterium]|nr:1-acyl-sn-glycerol-3-phosphate acyltransferase [Polyangiaceae bacterium]MDW8250623.1 1-acyl-sn-glycerol-3-phosphate acyltransferase [Myxococcales bacterium]
MAFVLEERAVVVPGGDRWTGSLAGVLRMGYLAGACVVGAARVELAFRRGGRPKAAEKFKQIAREFCDIFGVRVEISGRLDPEVREVRIANHTSYLDVLALNAAGAGRFLSMKQVRDWPLVGLVAERIGTVFVDRDSTDGRAQGLKALHRAVAEPEAPVVVFPEGRTSKQGVLPFARGAFSAARSAGLPVRPLVLIYSDRNEAAWVDQMPLIEHVWKRLCGPEIRCVIRVLDTIDTKASSSSEELAIEAHRRVARALAAHAPS